MSVPYAAICQSPSTEQWQISDTTKGKFAMFLKANIQQDIKVLRQGEARQYAI